MKPSHILAITTLLVPALMLGNANLVYANEEDIPGDSTSETLTNIPVPELTIEEEQKAPPRTALKNQSTSQSVPAETSSDFTYPLPENKYWVSSYYGARCLVMLNSGTFHDAIDLAADNDTPTYSMLDGTVQSITPAKGKEVGGNITINHGLYKGKQLYLSYTHSWEPEKYFAVGDKVTKGDIIAPVGDSGIANGPHVHLAVNYGNEWVDPLAFFKSHGLDLTEGAYYSRPQLPDPEKCDVYNHGSIGLKSAPTYTSSILNVIPDGTKFEIIPGKPIEGHVEAKLKNGQKGWVRTENLSNSLRKTNPILKEEEIGFVEPGLTYTPYRSIQNFRDFPSYNLGEGGIYTTLNYGEKIISTGRSIKGTNWQEFNFNGLVGWTDRSVFKILNDSPQTVTSGPKDTKKTTSSNLLHPLPTFDELARDNKPIAINSNALIVTSGRYYRSWTEVKYNAKEYWVQSSSLKDYVEPPKLTINNPTIKPGDTLTRDPSGKLWNYSNLVKTPKNRTLISSGWNSMKDIMVTDFNADGIKDIISNSTDGKLYLYLGKKSGGFETRKTIGTSGWASLELNVTKLKKTDKYPTIIARHKNGLLTAYAGTGSGLKAPRTIGSGWQGFTSLNFLYFDADGNIYVIAQNKAGQQVLYRTNGSSFINEKRKIIGSGWNGLRSVTNSDSHSSKSTGIVAVNNNGKLYYYGASGKSTWNTSRLIGSSGWKAFYIVKSSI